MPKLDDLLKTNGKRIDSELQENARRLQTFVNRSAETRPWHSHTTELGFDESLTPNGRILPKNTNTVGIQHGTQHSVSVQNFLNFIVARKKNLILSLASAALVGSIIGWLTPSSYFSTMQIYAPEQVDDISSRLSLFSNRIVFASFPVANQLPASLLARHLQTEQAKQWVLNQFKSRGYENQLSTPLLQQTVRAEVNYASATQILEIDGYANTPEAASLITTLYWDYFLNLRKDMNLDHLKKVTAWFKYTNDRIDQKLADTMEQLSKFKGSTIVASEMGNIQTATTSYSSAQMKREQLSRKMAALSKALAIGTPQSFENVDDPDIQILIQVRRQILNQADNRYYIDRVSEIESQIKNLAQQKIAHYKFELGDLNAKAQYLNKELTTAKIMGGQALLSSEEASALASQLITLRSQKSDLLKLQVQLEVEPIVDASTYKVVREPLANPSSLRPIPTVKYVFAIVAMLILVSCGWAIAYALFLGRTAMS